MHITSLGQLMHPVLNTNTGTQVHRAMRIAYCVKSKHLMEHIRPILNPLSLSPNSFCSQFKTLFLIWNQVTVKQMLQPTNTWISLWQIPKQKKLKNSWGLPKIASELGTALQMWPYQYWAEGRTNSLHIPMMLFLIQPRRLLVVFDIRAHCWLMFNFLCTRTSGS